jgi:hypothetical protein
MAPKRKPAYRALGNEGCDMASFDAATARMEVDVEGSAPATDISADGGRAVFHLTRNAGPVIGLSRATSDVAASAIAFTGSIDAHLGPRETLNNFRFGFIQLCMLQSAQSVYAGRTSGDGSMAINFAVPPAFAKANAYEYNLDSDPAIFGAAVLPFTNNRAASIVPKMALTGPRAGRPVAGVQLVNVGMDDHPNSSMRLALRNSVTSADNFLTRATTEKFFLTALAVRDNATGTVTAFQYVAWHVRWHARYQWRSGTCTGAMQNTAWEIGPVTKWPPTDATLAAKITNPERDASKCANALVKAAIRKLNDAASRGSNVIAANRWPPDVPADFWR